MITRTATLLSLAGVLVAGSAAALVNSQVLQGSSGASADPSTLIVESPITTTSATATTVTVAPVTTDTVGGTATPSVTTYAVGDSGVVTLDTASGSLVLVSAVPNPGWTVATTGPNGLGGVGVTFRSPTVEVSFNAVLADGQVVTSVGAAAIDATGTSLEDETGNSVEDQIGNTVDDHGGDDSGDDSSGRGRGRGGDDDD